MSYVPTLIYSLALLAATAWAALADTPTSALAAAFALALALVATDLAKRRQLWPSPQVLVCAAALVAASALLASEPKYVAEMLPILGASAAFSVFPAREGAACGRFGFRLGSRSQA
jgi:hypothetical protein